MLYAGARQNQVRRLIKLPDCRHMLHHDQPQTLADLMEDFFR